MNRAKIRTEKSKTKGNSIPKYPEISFDVSSKKIKNSGIRKINEKSIKS
jgi:hypothetical protein